MYETDEDVKHLGTAFGGISVEILNRRRSHIKNEDKGHVEEHAHRDRDQDGEENDGELYT